MIKKSAFTLAEVLITLAIIGVVAAMTIPSLMNQTGDQEFKVGAKKALSVLSQAGTMNYAVDGFDYSGASASAISHDNAGSSKGTGLAGIFAARLNVVSTTAPTGWTAFSGTAPTNTYVLADGMVIGFPATCSASTQSNGCTVRVDVNGVKGPNVDNTATTAGNNQVRDRFTIKIWNQTAVIDPAAVAAIVTK